MDSFWLLCETDSLSTCHCDWRVTLEGCVEKGIVFRMYIVNIALSAILLVIGTVILFYRVPFKQGVFFDPVPYTYFIRPRPLQSLFVFGIIFTILRIISLTLIITNASPSPILTAFLYELPWQFGICALACYIFGIAHIVSNTCSMTNHYSVLHTNRVDLVFTLQTVCPFVLNNAFSIIAAVYAEKGNYSLAKAFTNGLYYMWTIHCIFLCLCSLYFGYGLMVLLKAHLRNQENQDEDDSKIQKIQNAIFRAKMLVLNTALTLFIFSVLKCIYSTFRLSLLKNEFYSYIMAAIWTFDGTFASAFVCLTLIINPKYISLHFFTHLSNSADSLYCSNELKNNVYIDEPVQVRVRSSSVHKASYFESQKSEYELATDSSRIKSKENSQPKIY
ncbi:hypothetical protein BY458DRAFT_505930 [Sporodiniella umbellata]|nr:hypothetical protein BY458DRAFT_505930 [Sporodiniella umbellata]